MKVLMIANSVSCYGANNSMLDLINPLRERGIEIVVLSPDRGELTLKLEEMCIEYYVMPYTYCASGLISYYEKFKKLLNNIMLIKDGGKIIKRCGIDLIHTNASNVDFGAFLSIIYHVPHVWHIRELLKEDYNLDYIFPKLQMYLMRRAQCLIAISKYVAHERTIGKNGVVIYNGFDIEKYVIYKKELFEDKIVHVLYCGKITRQKGVFDAIKAIQRIVTQGHKNYRLDIVGEKSEYCIKLLKYVQKNRLNEYIVFHGKQQDMRPFREKADIALMCSYHEALGRVTVESMLGECLVIGSGCGGTLELIKEGKTGLLYEAGNVNQLMAKILSVYQNVDNSKRMVREAKQFALKRFDSKKYAVKILNIYKKCIEEELK